MTMPFPESGHESGHEPAPHAAGHQPVLLDEVLAALAVGPGQHVVDATFGGGGYSAAFLARGARVTAFDRDPRAIAAGAALAERSAGRLRLVNRSFSFMAEELGPAAADGVAFDLGYSSIQMGDSSYGLSFQEDGPLDMRLSGDGATAADFLNHASEEEIATVLRDYGEEPAARRIARAIVARRPLHGTAELAALIRRVIPARPGGRSGPRPQRDPATKSFQAIRIHVNDELQELRLGLAAAEEVLRPAGRLAVVGFHSLEDRIVKQFLRRRSGGDPAGTRHRPLANSNRDIAFLPPAKARRPGLAEITRNPRARSAVLRMAIRATRPGAERGRP